MKNVAIRPSLSSSWTRALALPIALLALTAGCTGTAAPDGKPAAAASTTTERSAEATTKPPAKAAPTSRPLSLEERNAVQAAQGYLATQAFSRKGLIRQLSSEAGDGYPVKVATSAVDSLHVDWNEQAAKAAKQYLSTQSFSRRGLIEQLESDSGEGFTHSQAVYGVDKAGL